MRQYDNPRSRPRASRASAALKTAEASPRSSSSIDLQYKGWAFETPCPSSAARCAASSISLRARSSSPSCHDVTANSDITTVPMSSPKRSLTSRSRSGLQSASARSHWLRASRNSPLLKWTKARTRRAMFASILNPASSASRSIAEANSCALRSSPRVSNRVI